MNSIDKGLKPEVVRLRRQLHSIPELAFEEHKTAKAIVHYLTTVCCIPVSDVRQGVGKTGVLALIRSDRDPNRRCVALRADMDGLPLSETSDAIWASKHPNVMHACGHDAHMAMLLVAARHLQANRSMFAGTVKLIFQPAEEGRFGARAMIEDGVLEDPHVDSIYGAHVWNYCPSGEVHVRQGPLMAASDTFSVALSGKGGHGAEPSGTNDCIVAGSQLVTQLHTIVSRNISPLASGLVTIGTFNAGTNNNIIADNANFTGILRYFTDDVRETLKERISSVCNGIAASFGVKVDLTHDVGYPATINHSADCLNALTRAASKVVGCCNVKSASLTMAAEDFSYFLNDRPGCFFFIGSCPESSLSSGKSSRPHHRADFDIDELCLWHGVNIWVQLILDELAP